ncbi:hypothetical protein QKU48_gp0146 [Fadolivirus algeromassiliense]|jgi:hypothetical protein|uniref:Uncharacterized protein n=1 Tax=Fadolivirus FV1/VV64 TaxID=3070911 RepID=A0A7D3QUJ5_9VIRU|nr:hypothetical protein QKU48_gp0146 [Fadolivirus algeromassiliense]QKF93604.1 hypothetical protein Fadolivirus_1_146 [Fadolivirus FV1/VV64]
MIDDKLEPIIKKYITSCILDIICGSDHQYKTLNEFINDTSSMILQNFKENKKNLDIIENEKIPNIKWQQIDEISLDCLKFKLFSILKENPDHFNKEDLMYSYYIMLSQLNSATKRLSKLKLKNDLKIENKIDSNENLKDINDDNITINI